MSREKLIIVGTGSTARHALDFIRMYGLYDVIGFAVTKEFLTDHDFMQLPVYDIEKLHLEIRYDFKIFVAILWNRLNSDRRLIFDLCDRLGYDFATLISPSAIISPSTTIGRNCWIHDLAIVQVGTTIEDDVFARVNAIILHDCHISAHTFIGARATIGAGSKIGRQTFIGINATIFDDTTIGDKCIIGAGTTVKRNVPSFARYSTTSENIVIKQYRPEEIETKLLHSKNIR